MFKNVSIIYDVKSNEYLLKTTKNTFVDNFVQKIASTIFYKIFFNVLLIFSKLTNTVGYIIFIEQ